jgi:hypothetical protein
MTELAQIQPRRHFLLQVNLRPPNDSRGTYVS